MVVIKSREERELLLTPMSIKIFSYFPCDPPYVTNDLRDAGSFNNAMEKLKSEMDNLQKELKNSVPFFSSRYKVISRNYISKHPGLLFLS